MTGKISSYAEGAYQPLLATAYLRSLWSGDYARWTASGADAALIDRLRSWAAKEWQKETSAEGTFVDVFFKQIWGYTASGQSSGTPGFTLEAQYPVPNAGQHGGTGKADIALGHFGSPHAEPVPQVLGEFKDDRSGLEEAQKRSNQRSPVDQCFDYLREARAGRVSAVLPTWALVTDMNEFRLYRFGSKACYQRFVLRPSIGDPAVSLLEDDEPARFQRFIFGRMFHVDWLLAGTGLSPLEKLLDEQITYERALEADFYKEYHAYREHLFATLRAANPNYAMTGRLRQLVGLTQRLLDRFLFVLYCEDMGTQLDFPPDVMRKILVRESQDEFFMADGQTVWDRIRRLFQTMREGGPFGATRIHRFNGGLFAADPELDALVVPNSVFCAQNQGESATRLLAHPLTLLFFSSKYNFGTTDDEDGRTLTLTALGRIFEQSITDLEVMEARASGRASLSEITRRKRDGVYYTPEWTTRYIVEQTVGRRLQEIRSALGFDRVSTVTDAEVAAHQSDRRKAPMVRAYEAALHAYRQSLDTLKVVDPACGSGAFLIQAFQFLLAQRQWVASELERVTGTRGLFDTHAAMRAVLANNLYGVDINAESVEITRLALWLHTALPGRPLTSLDHNIRCGSALVSTDFAAQVAEPVEAADTLERVNPFDWHAAFPEVFARENAGFDCVIGNPPYVIFRNYRAVHEETVAYLEQARTPAGEPLYVSTQVAAPDLFLPFIERGVGLLNALGKLGYIAPSLWMNSAYGAGLRAFVKRSRCLERWIDFRDFQVFREATTYTALQFFSGSPVDAITHTDCADGALHAAHDRLGEDQTAYDTLEATAAWRLAPTVERSLLHKIAQHSRPLSDVDGLVVGFRGVECGADALYHFHRLGPNRYVHCKGPHKGTEVALEDALLRPLASTSDARRYCTPQTSLWVLFPYTVQDGRSVVLDRDTLQVQYPRVWDYFAAHEAALQARDKGKMGLKTCWWGYTRPMNLEKMLWPKLGVAQTVRRPEVFFDHGGEVFFNNVRVGGIGGVDATQLWFLLGVLNAPVVNYVFRRIAKAKQGGYFEANRQYLEPLPIPMANASEQAAVAKGAKNLQAMVTERVDRVRSLQRRLGSAQCRLDARTPDWIWADVRTPVVWKAEAPAALRGRARARWGKAEHATRLDRHLDGLDLMLRAETTLTVQQVDTELLLLVGGVPAIEGIFFARKEAAAFVAAQWRQALRERPGRTLDARRLMKALLGLRQTENPAIIGQVIELDEEIRALDARIAAADAALGDQICSLYRLTEAEQRCVASG